MTHVESAALLGSAPPKQCRCCPYGFHIDLDFVKFAEDISLGKEQMQNWSVEPNAKRIRVMSPTIMSRQVPRNPTPVRPPHGTSTGNGFTNGIRSSNNIIPQNYPENYETSKQYESISSSILKHNVKDNNDKTLHSTVPSVRFTTLPSHSGRHFENQSHYPQNYSSMTAPKSMSHSFIVEQNNVTPKSSTKSRKDDYSTKPSFPNPMYKRHPLMGARQPATYIDKSPRHERIISAPTSPVPKTFRTAIAQSMAQLKHIPLATTNQLAYSDMNSNIGNQVDSGDEPTKIYDSAAVRAQGSFYPTTANRAWTPNPNFRRNRILSPEPETSRISGISASPMALRTYNRQSRSYFHNNNTTNGVIENGASVPNNTAVPLFPYREAADTAITPSLSLFNLEAFASVRRPKTFANDEHSDLVHRASPFASPLNNVSAIRRSDFTPSSIPPVAGDNGRQLNPKNVMMTASYIMENGKSEKRANSTVPRQRHFAEASTNTEEATLHDSGTKPEIKIDSKICDNVANGFSAKKNLRLELQCCIGHEPEHFRDCLTQDCATNTIPRVMLNQRQQTDSPSMSHQSMNTDTPIKIATKTQSTSTTNLTAKTIETQTMDINKTTKSIETQTDVNKEKEWIKVIFEECSRKAGFNNNRNTANKTTETEEDVNEFILVACSKCDNSSLTASSSIDADHIYEKISDPELSFIRNETTMKMSKEIFDTNKRNSNENVGYVEIRTSSDDVQRYRNDRRNSAPDVSSANQKFSVNERPISHMNRSVSEKQCVLNAKICLDFVKSQRQNYEEEKLTSTSEEPTIEISTESINLADDKFDTTILRSEESKELLCPHPSIRLNTLNNDERETDADSDRISIDTDVQTIIVAGKNASCSPSSLSIGSVSTVISEATTIEPDQRLLDPSSTEAIRKLLTEPQTNSTGSSSSSGKSSDNGGFRRNAVNYRSCRIERSKSSDLDYIADRHTNKTDSHAEPSTPSSIAGDVQDTGLKKMVILKKASIPSESPENFSDNTSNSINSHGILPASCSFSARIPRPKYFTKYSSPPTSLQIPETPDEEAEAADHLTPLRSEMRSLSTWGNSRRFNNGYNGQSQRDNLFDLPNDNYRYNEDDFVYDDGRIVFQEDDFFDEADEDDQDSGVRRPESSSSIEGGAQSDATYEMSDGESGETSAIYFENDDTQLGSLKLSDPLIDALVTLNEMIRKEATAHNVSTLEDLLKKSESAVTLVRHEWLKVSTKRTANAQLVEAFLRFVSSNFSMELMTLIVNLTDQNGNMALHYAVSHENYDIVSVLLDAKTCNVDFMNRAGYSAVMLGALCEIHNGTESAIVHRLFHVGNVNAKAVKHSQTALMLAASHGRIETTELLLSCGADVNVQDVDGSTALMCAAEHGQKEIVKILLKQPNIDASLTDCDNQTALSIAVENQHRDIGVIIYAHLNFSRLEQNDNSVVI